MATNGLAIAIWAGTSHGRCDGGMMGIMTETRSSLLLRVRNTADTESWREFVTLYEPLLLGYVRHQGLTESDAGDVVQEVFMALLRAMPQFQLDRERGRFRTWLWQVTRHALANWARRQRRSTAAEELWRQRMANEPAGDEPELEFLQAHRQRVLEFVLQQIQAQTLEKTWACFEQHVLLGRPSATVGAELGLTANAVNVNASRVLARVRQACAEFCEVLSHDRV